MSSKAEDLHMLFFPLMAQGHTLPLVDMAKLFAARGARITVLTTPVYAAIIRPTIDASVHLHIIPSPSTEFGLPDDQLNNFFKALPSLRNHFDSVLSDLRPDCVITDMFLPWTYHVAAARGVPRLVFHGTSNFALCAADALEWYRLLIDEAESFVLSGMPNQIQMLRTQVIDLNKFVGTPWQCMSEIFNEIAEVEPLSYGVVVNSFYELEPEYANHYREVMGRVWNVGPVSLCNKEVANQSSRGGKLSASANECLKWLDKKPTGSVVYMSFGSEGLFSVAQLREMALGLEASRHPFVWVVLNEGDDWVPEGYEERIKGIGMMIRGWAPQLLMLNHSAVGGFVTHCGWNSSLEGICAGLPMVTWPLCADQFFNEKLLVEVLKIGVEVGSKVYSFNAETRPIVEAVAVEVAVRRVMGEGEEAKERRKRAKQLGKMAKRAMEKGGSSYEEMENLMHELMDQMKHV